MISNQVVLHHTVHVQKGMYHAPPYTDPFMAACPAVGCIILNGHVGVSGCLATAAVSESNESTERREHVRMEGWISQTSESGCPFHALRDMLKSLRRVFLHVAGAVLSKSTCVWQRKIPT